LHVPRVRGAQGDPAKELKIGSGLMKIKNTMALLRERKSAFPELFSLLNSK
jgi:hypothetical protein